MDRTACVDLPALPLQLLLRRHPQAASRPAAVVEQDRPLARILWVNERARDAGVLPGQRYAVALSLLPQLHAGVISAADVSTAVGSLSLHLRRFSPGLRCALEEPGVFWLDADGLLPLYSSLGAWAHELHGSLTSLGLSAKVVVGWSSFGSYALAKVASGVRVLDSLAVEQRALRRVALAALHLAPELRERLGRLGVHTLGELLGLPANGVLRRFGPEAYRLHRLASGESIDVAESLAESAPLRRTFTLEPPERDTPRLLRALRPLLDELLDELSGQGGAAAELRLGLVPEREGEVQRHRLRPAAPTRDADLLMELLDLRLQAAAPQQPVEQIVLQLVEAPAETEQIELVQQRARRDRVAGERALARVRAEFGDDAVSCLLAAEEHLPEARVLRMPLGVLRPAAPQVSERRMLVRRLLSQPRPLPPRPRDLRNEGWRPRRPEQGTVRRLLGPYLISGQWWRGGQWREYSFAETARGDILWIYYDRTRRCWFEQGRVE